LLEFRWWICGVNSTFWYYSICLILLVCGESRSIMNTLYAVQNLITSRRNLSSSLNDDPFRTTLSLPKR
jgi:hypothetical protein